MQARTPEVSAEKATTADLDSVVAAILQENGNPDGVELEPCFVTTRQGIAPGIGFYTEDMDYPLAITLPKLKQLVEAIEAEIANG
ncbi:hypothetical protein [Stenotrophomonas sp.]|uniref:hypothetical protein n=1 Tax=Stenotrophomonas sp. TaxID=69392 RepID=UPI0028A6C9B6|nr:hypothetical protein [Stenotrophomonas sp.]